jgi:hypothetical protein
LITFHCPHCEKYFRGPKSSAGLYRHLGDEHGIPGEPAYELVYAMIYPEEKRTQPGEAIANAEGGASHE